MFVSLSFSHCGCFILCALAARIEALLCFYVSCRRYITSCSVRRRVLTTQDLQQLISVNESPNGFDFPVDRLQPCVDVHHRTLTDVRGRQTDTKRCRIYSASLSHWGFSPD